MTINDDTASEARQMAEMTLQDIEHDDWGDPATGETSMIRRCLELRRTPLNQFKDEDVRLLIGQRISLPIMVPLALGMLGVNPWLGGDMQMGTLLAYVIAVKSDYWRSHTDQQATLDAIVARQVAAVSEDPCLVARASVGYVPPETDYALFMLIGLPSAYWQAHPTLEERLSDSVDHVIARLNDDPWYEPPSEPSQALPNLLWYLTNLPISYFDNHLDQAAHIVVLVDKALTTLEHNPWHPGPEWRLPGGGLAILMDLPNYPWANHPDQKARLEGIVQRVTEVLGSDPGFVPPGDSVAQPGQVLSLLALPDHDYWLSHPEQARAIQNINAQTIEPPVAGGDARSRRSRARPGS